MLRSASDRFSLMPLLRIGGGVCMHSMVVDTSKDIKSYQNLDVVSANIIKHLSPFEVIKLNIEATKEFFVRK
jgi:hypothetical protein